MYTATPIQSYSTDANLCIPRFSRAEPTMVLLEAQSGPLPCFLSRVISSFIGVEKNQLPIYKATYIQEVITPFITM